MHDLVKNLPTQQLTPAQEGRLSRENLVLHSLRRAFFYARKCCRKVIPDNEVFSICYAALRAAANTYIPGGITFFAFSKVYIRGALHRSWRDKDLVKNTARRDLINLDAPTDDPEEQKLLSDVCVLPNFQKIHSSELRRLLNRMLRSRRMKPLERKVIRMRYLRDKSFTEIAVRLGSSRQYAHKITTLAMKKFRIVVKYHPLRDELL